jgi:hypothetical protein
MCSDRTSIPHNHIDGGFLVKIEIMPLLPATQWSRKGASPHLQRVNTAMQRQHSALPYHGFGYVYRPLIKAPSA